MIGEQKQLLEHTKMEYQKRLQVVSGLTVVFFITG